MLELGEDSIGLAEGVHIAVIYFQLVHSFQVNGDAVRSQGATTDIPEGAQRDKGDFVAVSQLDYPLHLLGAARQDDASGADIPFALNGVPIGASSSVNMGDYRVLRNILRADYGFKGTDEFSGKAHL
jgi:hypothetical protein